MTDQRERRYSSEPAAALFGNEPAVAADAPRPSPIVGGTVLVLLRAVAAVFWWIAFVIAWPKTYASLDISPDNELNPQLILWILLGFGAVWTLFLVVLSGWLWRGSNRARILVMTWTSLSITIAAVNYFAIGEEVTIRTTLLTLSLDILVLLALSSRDARRWARRPRPAD